MIERPDLVQRRLAYVQRQIALDQGSVNVKVRGLAPEGSGPPNRHGMPRLPVGQHGVKNWIDFLAEDQKGFWEVRGYSNTAEPWFGDRYASD